MSEDTLGLIEVDDDTLIIVSNGVGPQGLQGVQGIQGQQGIQGEAGPQGAAGSGITYKGTVATVANLPGSGNVVGDAYTALDTSHLWIYSGSAFVDNGNLQGPPGPPGTPAEVQYTVYHPIDYGAIIGQDNTAAIQACLDAAKADAFANRHRVVVSLRGYKWKITNRVTIDSHFVNFDGGGCVIDATGIANGVTALYVTATQDQVEGQKSWNNSACNIGNFELIGPGGTATYLATNGIKFEQTSGGSGGVGPARLSLRNVAVHDFGTCVTYGSNTWGIQHDNCAFYNANIAVNFPFGLTNAGERMSYQNCVLFSARILVINGASGCDMQFVNCSLDYPTIDGSLTGLGVAGTSNPKQLMTYASGGRIYLTNCHIEGSHDTDYWFRTGVDNTFDAVTRTVLTSCEIVIAHSKTNFELFHTSDTAGPSGVTIENCHIHMNSAYNYNLGTLCGGNGMVRARGVSFETNVVNWVPPMSRNMGRIDGTFENSSWALKPWNLAFSTLVADQPVLATDQFRLGTQSFKFAVATSGHHSKALAYVPLYPGPGSTVFMSLWTCIQGLDAGGHTFTLTLQFFDGEPVQSGATFSGTNITAVGNAITYGATPTLGDPDHWGDTAVGTFVLRKITPLIVPRQATHLSVFFQGTSMPTGAAVWVDDFTINVLG